MDKHEAESTLEEVLELPRVRGTQQLLLSLASYGKVVAARLKQRPLNTHTYNTQPGAVEAVYRPLTIASIGLRKVERPGAIEYMYDTDRKVLNSEKGDCRPKGRSDTLALSDRLLPGPVAVKSTIRENCRVLIPRQIRFVSYRLNVLVAIIFTSFMVTIN